MTLDRIFKSVLKIAAICFGIFIILKFLLFLFILVVSVLDVM